MRTTEFEIFLKWIKSYAFVAKHMINFKITLLFVYGFIA